jgi:integrase
MPNDPNRMNLTQDAVDKPKPPKKDPNRMNLTQKAVEKLEPPPTQHIIHWDTNLPGFGVRVSSKGRKTWIAMYTVGKKAVMETIGTTFTIPKVGVARELARESQFKASRGINPVEERRAKLAQEEAARVEEAKTFRWLLGHEEIDARGRKHRRGFIEQYAKVRQRPSSLYETERVMRRVLDSKWVDKPLTEVRRVDVTRMLDDIAAQRKRQRKDATTGPLSQARAAQVFVNTVFRWAVREELLGVNPIENMDKEKYGKTGVRERVLDDDEIRAFWSTMEAMGWPFGPVGKLLLLTGQREGEVAGMRWSELDVPNRVWRLPGSRTKNKRPHDVHLSPVVLDIIEALPRFSDDFVFSTTGDKAVSGFGNVKGRVDALMGGELAEGGLTLKPWVWHDLRRTATTIMAKLNVPPHVADKVLNHVEGTGKITGVAAVYNRHEYLDERKAALETLARYLVDTVNGGGAENVVQLRNPA